MTKGIIVTKDGKVGLVRKIRFHHEAKNFVVNPSSIKEVYLYINGQYVDCLGNPMPSNIQIPVLDIYGTKRG